jgi:hypothetical protein
MREPDGGGELARVSILRAALTFSREVDCPVCGTPLRSAHHRRGCDFIRKRILGLSIFVGTLDVALLTSDGGVWMGVLFAAVVVVAAWWAIRRASRQAS